MRMRYQLSATELLELLGFGTKIEQKKWDQFMPKDVPLPKVYQEFMGYAIGCPLLETSDIWMDRIGETGLRPYFLYQEIEEMIADQKKDWEEDPEFAAESAYYPFFRLPKERWPELIGDILQIGSDYGAGVVSFGIRKEDLTKDDPPVWMNHEADALTDWKKMYDSVSDFLMETLLHVLACIDYDTAEAALEDKGWSYIEGDEVEDPEEGELEDEELEFGEEDPVLEKRLEQMLKNYGIDVSQIQQFNSVTMGKIGCCYEEEKQRLYLVEWEEGERNLLCIEKGY